MENKNLENRTNKLIVANSFFDLSLKSITKAAQMDIFYAIMLKFQQLGESEYVLSAEEVRKDFPIKARSAQNYIERMQSACEAIAGIEVDKAKFDTKIGSVNLVEYCLYDTKTGSLHIKLTETYRRLFGMQLGNFTKLDIERQRCIKQIYAKKCLLYIEKNIGLGKFSMDIERFSRELNLSAGTRKRLKEKVVNPVEEILRSFFPGLKINIKHSDNKQGSPVSHIEFTFDKVQNGYKVTTHVCPKCKKTLYEKIINGKACYCHKDYLNGNCSLIYNAVSDIYGLSETPSRRTTKTANMEAVPKVDEKTTTGIGEISRATYESLAEKGIVLSGVKVV